MINLLITNFIFLCFNVAELDVKNIPTHLLVYASAVVRFENTVTTIPSLDKVETTYDGAITVLNQKGRFAGKISIPYQKNTSKIKKLYVKIYNAKGKLIHKVKRKEVQDIASYDGFSIASDSRLLVYEYITDNYPFTIKYSYKKESINTLTIGGWYPQWGTGIAIESSSHRINNKAEIELLSKKYNIDTTTTTIDLDNYVFSAKNIMAIKQESNAPHFLEYAPFVRLIPKSFKYYGETGEINDWQTYGKWVYDKLLEGRNDIPEELKSTIQSMIPDGISDVEKAKIIYQYVTNSTRYVSVQLGVGGLQPFKCSKVYNLKYGDCKALSYYTANLLNLVGVDAIYTEIYLDDKYARSYDNDFPGLQGNHIVLCLPSEKDTTWLECTSDGVLFGYTHSGISDRRALLIKPEGGKITKTNGYTAEVNKKIILGEISIFEGNKVDLKLKGEYYNFRFEKRQALLDLKYEKQIKYLKSFYYDNLPSLKILDYKIDVDSNQIKLIEDAHFKSNNLLESAGDYRMIPYNISNISVPIKLQSNRTLDIYIKEAMSDQIILTIEIPKGYTVLQKPEDEISFENIFGSIRSNLIKLDQNKIQISTQIIKNKGTFSASEFGAYNAFINALNTYTKQKLVLKPI